MADRVLPQTGWVPPTELVHCDICGRRCWVWELHHLVPISWGGSDSRKVDDHQVVWVRADGDCHSTVHMILDKAKADGGWPAVWLSQQEIPHLVAETARRGWAAWKQATFGVPPMEAGGTIP
jgi:hypothetical protein